MLKWRYPDKPIETTQDFVCGLREGEWLCNGKYDGWRAPIFSDEHGKAHIFSRAGRPMNEATKVPVELQRQVEKFTLTLPPNSVLDSEFVGPRGGHSPRIFLFDVLAWDGSWLMKVPYEQRWGMLVNAYRANQPESHIELTETVTENFLVYFNKLKKIWTDGGCSTLDLHEGVVLKRRIGTLTLDLNSSATSRHMFKWKFRDIRESRF